MLDKYKGDIYRLAYTYVNNEADALDIVQETAYQAYISRGKIRDKSKVKNYTLILWKLKRSGLKFRKMKKQ